MKILEIDYDYYYYPQGIDSMEAFVAYANAHYHSFIKLTRFETENCAFPYFVREDVKTVYANIADMGKITEAEVTVLPRAEYDARLAEAVKKKCLDCVYYEEDLDGDNMKGHRGKLTLDGECWGYERKKEE